MTNKDLVLLLKNNFKNLKEIYLVRSDYDYKILTQNLGKKAAENFDDVIQNSDNPKIGIGGGSTIYELVNTLKRKERRIRIFPTALIGRGPELNFVDSTFLVKMLFQKSKPLAKAFVTNIPPLPNKVNDAKNFKNFLLENISEVKWIYNAMQDIDIAFIGLGSSIPTGDFDNEMKKLGLPVQNLIDQNIIGGINYNWFDSNGNQLLDYFLSISIKQLQSLAKNDNKNITLVAGGLHKVPSIIVALKYKMVNRLITDTETAKKLLDKNYDNR